MKRSIHRLASADLALAVRFYKSEAGVGLARRFLKDALHNSLRTVAARTRAVYGVVFLANSRAIGCKKRLVAHPDPRHHSLARVMQGILNEFERVAMLLEQHPGIGTPTTDGRRVHPLSDFPYSVIYRHDNSELRILVVRHHSRDPDYGNGR